MQNELPEEISYDDWNAVIQSYKVSGLTPTYAEVLELAKGSWMLREAFTDDFSYELGSFQAGKTRFQTHWILGIIKVPNKELSDKEIETKILQVINGAKTDRDVFDGFFQALGKVIERGLPIPKPAQAAIAEFLMAVPERPARKRGRHPEEKIYRDSPLLMFFNDMHSIGVSITENEASFRGESAAHAVVEAYADFDDVPSVKTLMNLWSKRSRK